MQKDGRNVNYAIVDIVGEYVDSTDGIVQSLSDFMTFNSFGKILESLAGGGMLFPVREGVSPKLSQA